MMKAFSVIWLIVILVGGSSSAGDSMPFASGPVAKLVDTATAVSSGYPSGLVCKGCLCTAKGAEAKYVSSVGSTLVFLPERLARSLYWRLQSYARRNPRRTERIRWGVNTIYVPPQGDEALICGASVPHRPEHLSYTCATIPLAHLDTLGALDQRESFPRSPDQGPRMQPDRENQVSPHDPNQGLWLQPGRENQVSPHDPNQGLWLQPGRENQVSPHDPNQGLWLQPGRENDSPMIRRLKDIRQDIRSLRPRS